MRPSALTAAPLVVACIALAGPAGGAARDRSDAAGFAFRAGFGDDRVALGRPDYALPSGRPWRVMPAYMGVSLPVLEVLPGPGPARRTAVEDKSWEHQVARYELAGAGRASVVVSRLSPAVLFESTGDTMTLGGAKSGESAALPAYVAWVSKGQVMACSTKNIASGMPAVDEPWLLAWFGAGTPYRGYAGVIDVNDEHDGAGFARMAPPPVPLDVPILIRLEKKPRSIALEQEALALRFAGACGKVALMPLLGGEVIEPKQTQEWRSRLPDEIVARCRLWSAALRDYPLGVKEDCGVDADEGVVAVRQAFTWASFEDDWESPPLKAAPVPPMLALALGGKVPVTFHKPDGTAVQPTDCRFMDTPGKAMAIHGVDAYEYRVTGLREYLLPQAKEPNVADAAKPFQARLEKHVNEMIDAGHLAPLYYVYGGLGGLKPGYFYWANAAELAEALAAAWPYLSPALQERARAYLRSEWRINPPLELNLKSYREGANRAPYEFPWNDIDPREMNGVHARERGVREGRFFADLYGVALYAQLTGDKPDASSLKSRIDRLTRDLQATHDWALMTPVRGHSDRLEFMTGASYYERNGQAACNGLVAGSIGLVRLSRLLDWPEQQRLGTCLFAKAALARIGQARYVVEAHRMGLVRGDAKDDWRTLVHVDANCALLLRGNPKAVSQEDQELPPFIDLTPEVGRLLGRHAREECRIYLDHLDRSMPLWYISEAPKQSASEQRLCPLQHKSGNVLAQSWVLGKTGKSFTRYVDTTRFKGDLYYIKNLAAAIESNVAAAPGPSP